jgi:SOS-response transcriptional repressor LexA
MNIIAQRISQRIHDLDTNAAAVARDAKIGTTAVHDILTGKNKKPSVPHLLAIARALRCDLAYLIGEQDSPTLQPEVRGSEPIAVAGFAEAGAFRVMPEVWHEFEHDLPRIGAPKSPSFPKAKHFALEVRGDSMNATKPTPILSGMMVLCVDIIDADIPIESGQIYAVRRTRDAGQTWEITVKRARVFRDRIELHPESTNPTHQPFIIRNHEDAADHHTIEAFGLVYAVYASLSPYG